MRHLVHVISDLHLGGAAASPGSAAFQMCPPRTHALLSAFIDRLPASSHDQLSHLIIAGDLVDFLAEEPFEAFTADPIAACAKLQRIFDTSMSFWDALNRFSLQRRGVLSIMLGNHDIELSLPGVREMLFARVRGERVRFMYDNEAFTLGPLLIEHGNRFDPWNAVPHGALRRVRSQLSRRLDVWPAFPALPGSQMVIDVINPLKRDYPFVDLLKPETAAALPIAAALGAVGLPRAWKAFGKFRASQANDYDESSGEPLDPNMVSGFDHSDDELWSAAQDISHGENSQQVNAIGDVLGKGVTAVSNAIKTARIDALFGAFRKLRALQRLHRETFDIGTELPTYLIPATRAAEAGFKVIVYGHTHLPKRVPVKIAGQESAVYLNSGTWADVMCVPEGIWDADEANGRTLFRQFANDLGANSLDKWRRSIATYARIAIDGSEVESANIHFADDDMLVSTTALMERLASPVKV